MPDYKSIVVLTGAGVSAESGIKTFRASDGFWENHPVEDVATPEGFHRNPALVQAFYNTRRHHLQQVTCNRAHQALAVFERDFSGDFLLVTQNIDDLHERAGSQNLIHMHGELYQVRCKQTGAVYPWRDDLVPEVPCPCCDMKGNLRPNIVWFGEMPFEMDRIYDALSCCDLFVAIGTSGNVYPAAGFFSEARAHGAATVEMNLDPGCHASGFDRVINGMATETVPAFLKGIMGRDE